MTEPNPDRAEINAAAVADIRRTLISLRRSDEEFAGSRPPAANSALINQEIQRLLGRIDRVLDPGIGIGEAIAKWEACVARRAAFASRTSVSGDCDTLADKAVTWRRASGPDAGKLTDYVPGCMRHATAEYQRVTAGGVVLTDKFIAELNDDEVAAGVTASIAIERLVDVLREIAG